MGASVSKADGLEGGAPRLEDRTGGLGQPVSPTAGAGLGGEEAHSRKRKSGVEQLEGQDKVRGGALRPWPRGHRFMTAPESGAHSCPPSRLHQSTQLAECGRPGASGARGELGGGPCPTFLEHLCSTPLWRAGGGLQTRMTGAVPVPLPAPYVP